jgi:hypothetical protein
MEICFDILYILKYNSRVFWHTEVLNMLEYIYASLV